MSVNNSQHILSMHHAPAGFWALDIAFHAMPITPKSSILIILWMKSNYVCKFEQPVTGSIYEFRIVPLTTTLNYQEISH